MAPLRWNLRRPRRFSRLDGGRRALLMEAVVLLAAARIAVHLVPFRMLARRLGRFVRPQDEACILARMNSSTSQADLAREIGWAVTRAARHAPFEAVCLPQAIAAQIMLRRRGVASVMHFGAAPGKTDQLDAHAWLDAAGVEVTGYPVEQHLAEIACIV